MAAAARYFDLVREMKNPYNHRLRLVESAKQRGIKPTAFCALAVSDAPNRELRNYYKEHQAVVLRSKCGRHDLSQGRG